MVPLKFYRAINEFKGVVKTMFESLNVRIMKSAAYCKQTQGKDEYSHRTLKKKLKFDIVVNLIGKSMS